MESKLIDRWPPGDPWPPIMPDLDVKTVDFTVVKRTLQERIGRDVLNIEVEVEPFFDYLVFRMTQRILTKQADESVVTGSEMHTDKQTYREFEMVPADWWSHILVAIVGGVSVPDGYGWRWKILKHAKLRAITVATTNVTATTHTHITKFSRFCPHVHIPDNDFHIRWLINVNDDANEARWKERQR